MAQPGLIATIADSNTVDAKFFESISHSVTGPAESDDVKWTENQEEFLNSFKTVSKDPELLGRFQESLAAELKKPEVRMDLNAELEKLTETVFRIKRDFELVGHTLIRFDAKGFRKLKPDGTAGGDLIDPLLPQWKRFQDKFNELVRQSQKSAEDGVYQGQRYRKVILDLATDTSTMDDAKIEVEGFIEDIEKLYNESAVLSAVLDNLRSDISSFKTVMSVAIQQAGENVDKEINEVEAKIEEVRTELGSYKTMATVGWASLAGGATVGLGIGAAVGLGLAAMTPVGWVLAAAAALAVIGGLAAGIAGEVKKVQLSNKLGELEGRLAELTKQQQEVEALRILFKKAEAQIQDICDSITIIANVWSLFRLEANTLKKALIDAKDAKTKSGLIRQARMAKDTFEVLETNLTIYATKIAAVEKRQTNPE